MTSSKWRKLHRLGQSDQLDRDISKWLSDKDMRCKIETLMTLLECSAVEAVHVHLLNCIAIYTDAAEPEDNYGPGANPTPDEDD